MLEAVSVPVIAQSLLLLPSGIEGEPSTECVINGNDNRGEERIHHMPIRHFNPKLKWMLDLADIGFARPRKPKLRGGIER